jgi:type VI secretion system protein ImpA
VSTIDLDGLLGEIAPEAPCGEDLEYDAAFIDIGEKIKGTPERQIGNTIEPAEPPNWKEVRKDLLALFKRTRDLRLIVFLARTLLHTDGLVGFRDSLTLLDGAVRGYWPSIHPLMDPDDDNDPTQRVNILMGLCDFETVLSPLALTPLVESRALGRFSLRDVQIATGKLAPPKDSPAPEASAIQAAFMDADLASLEATARALADGLSLLTAIEAFVTDQVGVGNAPNFTPARTVLKDIQHEFSEYARPRNVGLHAVQPIEATLEGGLVGEEGAAAAPGTAAPAATVQLAAVNNRQDVLRALDLICDYYARSEPSSPVPLFLQRAKRLVSKDFMEILMDLAPDSLPQLEVIKGKDA